MDKEQLYIKVLLNNMDKFNKMYNNHIINNLSPIIISNTVINIYVL
jgi:hypothetical protein